MKQNEDLWSIERNLHAEGLTNVCGIDEAGRGPLAGPVIAAAVILKPDSLLPGLNDSKKLSAKKRDELYDMIISQAVAWGIGSASEQEIDTCNILNATYQAMNRAVSMLRVAPDILLVDGNRNTGIVGNSQCIVKGDAKCACIAAASILAKVTRDRLMVEMSHKYPQYGFELHKGYGTALHYERLRIYGPSEIHRKTFLKKMH